MPRTPKPVAPPSTLAAAVLDLEERMTGGDALSEVLLPAEDWTRLVEMAEDADLPSAELLELRRFREDMREALAMGPKATCLDLVNELDATFGRARERWTQKPAEPFEAVPPPKKKRKAKTDEAPVEPEAPQHRMRIEDVEEDAA